MKRKTKEEWVEQFKQIHGDKYEYINLLYKNNKPYFKIKCLSCNNVFTQLSYNHKQGAGCPICAKNNSIELRKKSLTEWIIDFKRVHGDKYEYLEIIYDNGTKIKYKCKCNHIIIQPVSAHKLGSGCRYCRGYEKPFDVWVKELHEVHGDKYEYIDIFKDNRLLKIKYKCSKCDNIIIQTIYDHRKWHGCKYCSYKKSGMNKRKPKNEIFDELNKIHDGKFKYIDIFYKNSCAYVIIECNNGHQFTQRVSDHKNYKNCPICIGAGRKPKDEWVKEFQKIHGTNYEYLDFFYKNYAAYFKIKCNKCGYEFIQKASKHKLGSGCKYCNTSKGEALIRTWLNNNNINYVHQYSVYINNKLHIFDFFVEDFNIIIEFDGIQHYKCVYKFGGKEAFYKRVERDIEKDEYCLNNGINMIRIPYWEYNHIEEILNEKLLLKFSY